MDNDNEKGKFRLVELIMVNPFNNWLFSFVGTTKKIGNGKDDPYYFGIVEIELNKICCVSVDKEKVAKNLEFIVSLKYQYPILKKSIPVYKTQFSELILN